MVIHNLLVSTLARENGLGMSRVEIVVSGNFFQIFFGLCLTNPIGCRILDADFEYDNGRYVCQVTASGFRETDTLISREAVLSVRGKPIFHISNTLG